MDGNKSHFLPCHITKQFMANYRSSIQITFNRQGMLIYFSS
jgi:hypothetical protein